MHLYVRDKIPFRYSESKPKQVIIIPLTGIQYQLMLRYHNMKNLMLKYHKMKKWEHLYKNRIQVSTIFMVATGPRSPGNPGIWPFVLECPGMSWNFLHFCPLSWKCPGISLEASIHFFICNFSIVQ